MKTFFLLLLNFYFLLSFSQPTEKELKKHHEKIAESKAKNKTVLSMDTIYNAGNAYAVLKLKKKGMIRNYTLSSLTGKELVEIVEEYIEDKSSSTGEKWYYAFLFLQSGKRGEMEVFIGDKMEKIIVESDLVKDNEINPAGENKFLMKYPPKFSQQQNQPLIIINNNPTPTTTTDPSGCNCSQPERLFFGS